MNSFVLAIKQKHASWPGRCSRLGAVCVLSSIYTLTLAWWTCFYLDASGVLRKTYKEANTQLEGLVVAMRLMDCALA